MMRLPSSVPVPAPEPVAPNRGSPSPDELGCCVDVPWNGAGLICQCLWWFQHHCRQRWAQLRGAPDQQGGRDELCTSGHFQGMRDYGARAAPSAEKTERSVGGWGDVQEEQKEALKILFSSRVFQQQLIIPLFLESVFLNNVINELITFVKHLPRVRQRANHFTCTIFTSHNQSHWSLCCFGEGNWGSETWSNMALITQEVTEPWFRPRQCDTRARCLHSHVHWNQ